MGTIVAPIDIAGAKKGIVIRRTLQREVVKFIRENGVHSKQPHDILALQRVPASHNDHIAFFKQVEEFYVALTGPADLPSACRLALSVKDHTDRAKTVLTANLTNRINAAFYKHIALVEAVKRRGLELSQALVSKHINAAFKTLENHAE